MQREKDKILAAAVGEGATVVSDGAKLKSRKRGMLNTGLSARKGAPPSSTLPHPIPPRPHPILHPVE